MPNTSDLANKRARRRNPMLSIRLAKITDAAAMHDLQQLAFAEEGRRSGTREIPPLVEGCCHHRAAHPA